eukprot:g5466.t1
MEEKFEDDFEDDEDLDVEDHFEEDDDDFEEDDFEDDEFEDEEEESPGENTQQDIESPRQNAQKYTESSHSAATKLQSRFRGYQSRCSTEDKALHRLKVKKQYAAICRIQAVARGRQQIKRYQKTKRKICRWRGEKLTALERRKKAEMGILQARLEKQEYDRIQAEKKRAKQFSEETKKEIFRDFRNELKRRAIRPNTLFLLLDGGRSMRVTYLEFQEVLQQLGIFRSLSECRILFRCISPLTDTLQRSELRRTLYPQKSKKMQNNQYKKRRTAFRVASKPTASTIAHIQGNSCNYDPIVFEQTSRFGPANPKEAKRIAQMEKRRRRASRAAAAALQKRRAEERKKKHVTSKTNIYGIHNDNSKKKNRRLARPQTAPPSRPKETIQIKQSETSAEIKMKVKKKRLSFFKNWPLLKQKQKIETPKWADEDEQMKKWRENGVYDNSMLTSLLQEYRNRKAGKEESRLNEVHRLMDESRSKILGIRRSKDVKTNDKERIYHWRKNRRKKSSLDIPRNKILLKTQNPKKKQANINLPRDFIILDEKRPQTAILAYPSNRKGNK